MEQLQKRLSEKNIRPSHHRIKILEYLDNHRIHPTVDMIYGDIKKDLPTISKTTIYNTLKTFLEKGLVSALTITEEEVRYDGNIDNHSHFLCKVCNKVIDLHHISPPEIEKTNFSGHDIEEIHLYFKGVCEDCYQKSH